MKCIPVATSVAAFAGDNDDNDTDNVVWGDVLTKYSRRPALTYQRHHFISLQPSTYKNVLRFAKKTASGTFRVLCRRRYDLKAQKKATTTFT